TNLSGGGSGEVVPDHRAPVAGRGRGRVEDLHRAALVDVADEPVVDAVPAQLAQSRLEARRALTRDAELLVLLLTDEARAVVHGDADAPIGRAVGTAAVPEAAVPHEHRALPHLGRHAVVGMAVVGGVIGEMRTGDDTG